MVPMRFGMFDFDSASGELRREGMPVRLQAQPARVLGMLVARPGEVVTREDLRSAIWGDETFVDFDRGLNFCIAQIRSALGDSADSPRYIRTVPKKGYEFIAPVSGGAKRRGTWWKAVAAGIVVLIAAGVYVWAHSRPRQITVAVARFDNETGNPDLDRFAQGMTDSVVAELTRAGGDRLGVIGNATVLRTARGFRDLQAIAASLGAGYVIIGQVQRNADHVRVLAHLIRMPEQKHVWVTRFDSTLDDQLRAESEMTQKIVSEFTSRLIPPPPH